MRQGYDPENGAYRGKEIYDPGSHAWYWLDNVQQGAKAVSKDVYQESQADDTGNIGKWVRYDAEGHMVKGWSTTWNGKYYFAPVYGTMAKGEVTIDGVTYSFDEGSGICQGEKTPETPGTGEEDKQPTGQPNQKDNDEEGRLVREYDADGYLAKEYTYNAGRMMEYQNDGNGNRTKTISYDADGKVTGRQEYQYDEQGNLKRAGAMAGNKGFKFSCDTQRGLLPEVFGYFRGILLYRR